MSDPLTDLVDDIQQNGLRWVTLVTLYSLYRKERRNHKLDLRDQAIFHNLRILMEDRGLGDQWKDGPKHGFPPMDLPSLKPLLIMLWKATRTPKSYYPKGMTKVKEYLKKLGSRKFQAYLMITLINIIMLVGYLYNVVNIQEIANQWMPVINLLVQAITTIVYQIVQGGVDKESQKQQVYIVPAPDPSPPLPADMSFDDIMHHVEKVNAELNHCLEQIKAGDLSEIPKEAMQLYLDISALIQRKSTKEEP